MQGEDFPDEMKHITVKTWLFVLF